MEQLADSGDGFVVYVSERQQARDVFVNKLPATLAVRALDAKVQVTFDPRAVASYRLIGYENRAAENSATVSVVDLGTEFDRSAPRLRVCYAAAFFAEVLRGSSHATE